MRRLQAKKKAYELLGGMSFVGVPKETLYQERQRHGIILFLVCVQYNDLFVLIYNLIHNLVIFAVSTTAPNPLQAIILLHSRVIQLPSWVDPNVLRYTLIIHPQNSPLSDEE